MAGTKAGALKSAAKRKAREQILPTIVRGGAGNTGGPIGGGGGGTVGGRMGATPLKVGPKTAAATARAARPPYPSAPAEIVRVTGFQLLDVLQEMINSGSIRLPVHGFLEAMVDFKRALKM